MTCPPCPICGGHMIMMYGCGWDYDRWLCGEIASDGMLCDGEIELNTTTTPEDVEESGP